MDFDYKQLAAEAETMSREAAETSTRPRPPKPRQQTRLVAVTNEMILQAALDRDLLPDATLRKVENYAKRLSDESEIKALLLRAVTERKDALSIEERARLIAAVQGANEAVSKIAGANEAAVLGELKPPRTFADIAAPTPEDQNPRALFKGGWLRKGGTAYLIAPSGIGKSVLINQLLYCWALGRAGCGPSPVRPLAIALIQAEDDDEEMGEFRQNLRAGFKQAGWTDTEISTAENSVCEESANFAGLTGEDFIRRLMQLQRARHYDLVVINPLQSYTGFDIAKNAELSHFLRDQSGAGLDSVSKGEETECGIIIVHHTNKPPQSAADRKGWGDEATAAYIGAGGAELVNHARAILVIRRETGADIFTLLGAKRGKRIGWTDANGKRIAKKTIGYSTDFIYWREVTGDELPQAKRPGREAEGNVEADALELANWVKENPSTRSDIRAHARQTIGKNRGDRAYTSFIHQYETHGLTEDIILGYARIGTKEALDRISRNGGGDNSGN